MNESSLVKKKGNCPYKNSHRLELAAQARVRHSRDWIVAVDWTASALSSPVLAREMTENAPYCGRPGRASEGGYWSRRDSVWERVRRLAVRSDGEGRPPPRFRLQVPR